MERRTFFGTFAAAVAAIFVFGRTRVAKASGPHAGDAQSISRYPAGTVLRPRKGLEYVPGPMPGTAVANWISVKDRLPPCDGRRNVLGSFVAMNGSGPVTTIFMAEEFHNDALLRRDGFAPTLTHWAELPAAPSEAASSRDEIIAELRNMPEEQQIVRRVRNPDGTDAYAICWMFDGKLCAFSGSAPITSFDRDSALDALKRQRRNRDQNSHRA